MDFDDNKRFCSSSSYHLRINNEDMISRVDDDKSEYRREYENLSFSIVVEELVKIN